MDEILYGSAGALAGAISDGKLSSAEVVEAHLDRIQEVNPRLNAVVQVRAEAALEDARRADADRARGVVHGPLHGVPMTIKDSLDTEGVVTTGGTKGRQAYVPQRDSTVVARLRGAGAILLGKTNTPELTLAAETDNLVYGRTDNPYDPSRTPGGSSGGAAAIVAAGGSPFDIGSDTGGSIRWPAHCCGIAGIKPTSGRVPRTGHVVPYGMGARDILTQNGPMARFVDDLVLVLPIISGPDWRDPAIAPVPLGDPSQVAMKDLRVAVHTDNGVVPATAPVAGVVDAAAAALTDAGVVVEEACPQALLRSHALFSDLGAADGRAWVRRLLAGAGTTEVHPWLQSRISGSRIMTSDEFGRVLEDLDRYRSDLLAFMESYDAILCPASPYPAIPHGTWLEEFGKGAFTYTAAYNLAGWPGAVVRGGTSPEGLPIGLQVVTRPWREDVALAVARYLEGALGGWQRPPL
ncbi:MAG: amidase [Dehalococcoidia bacterium]|nr:amidase [Dehalococcoidia bacterium]